jgi:hypothetical protein
MLVHKYISIKNNKLELDNINFNINHGIIIEPFSYEFSFIHCNKHNEHTYLINNINNNFAYIMKNKVFQIDLELNLDKLTYMNLKHNTINNYIINNNYHRDVIDYELINIQSKNNITYQFNNGFNLINNYINENVFIFVDLPNKYNITEIETFKDIKNKNYICKMFIIIPKRYDYINYINGDVLYELETYGTKLYKHVIISN